MNDSIEAAVRTLREQRKQLEAEGRLWDRRIERMRFHNVWQSAITVMWIAIALSTWLLFKR